MQTDHNIVIGLNYHHKFPTLFSPAAKEQKNGKGDRRSFPSRLIDVWWVRNSKNKAKTMRSNCLFLAASAASRIRLQLLCELNVQQLSLAISCNDDDISPLLLLLRHSILRYEMPLNAEACSMEFQCGARWANSIPRALTQHPLPFKNVHLEAKEAAG